MAYLNGQKIAFSSQVHLDMYDIGYNEGKQSILDSSKIIQETVSGTNTVFLEDVSEFPHTIECNISGVDDLTSVTIARIGKNLWGFGDLEFTDHKRVTFDALLPPGVYTITADITSADVSKTASPFVLIGADGSRVYSAYLPVTSPTKQTTFTINKSVAHVDIYASSVNDTSSGFKCTYANVQFEHGTTVTEYEPYTAQTFTADADGKVTGIESLPGYMYIMSNTEGINIEVTYNKSYGVHLSKDWFWRHFLRNMIKGSDSLYLFCGPGWNADTFYPIVDIKPKGSIASMFQCFSRLASPYLDMVQRLEECGVALDTSNATNFTLTFSECYVTRLPKISVVQATALDRTFSNATQIVTIDELQLRGQEEFDAGQNPNTFSNTFYGCTALVDITITGIIANNISFSNSSKLSTESVDSISAALIQLATGSAAKTVTFHATVKSKMTESQIAIITEQKGWTLA